MNAEDVVICDFGSELALLDSATHYRASQKDGQGPVSKIIERDPCPGCGRTIMIKTADGTGATFTRKHLSCVLKGYYGDEC